MKPITRLSIGTIFGLLVLGIVLMLNANWIKGSDVNRTPTITPRPQLLDTTVGAISQIQVVDVATGDRFVARRSSEPGTWEIAEAKKGVETKYGPDNTAIENAVSVLASITALRSMSQIEALAQYGLEAPAYKIIMTDSRGDTTITVGSKNPDQSAYYTQKSGSQEVFLISVYNLDGLINFLATPPYLEATPNPLATFAETLLPTETLSGSPTATPTIFIKTTLQFTPRATETPTPTQTYTPSPTKTPGPSPTPTK